MSNNEQPTNDDVVKALVEGAEAASRARMLLSGTGNRPLVSYYDDLHGKLMALADKLKATGAEGDRHE